MLRGREREQATLRGLVDRARTGHGSALLVRGQPGVGKSALLMDAADAADDLTVLRTRGVDRGQRDVNAVVDSRNAAAALESHPPAVPLEDGRTGEAARTRVLAEHTNDVRAAQFEAELERVLEHKGARR